MTQKTNKTLITLFSDYLTDYNANNLSKTINSTPRGARIILSNLLEKNVLTKEKKTYADIYKININNKYAIKLLEATYLDYTNYSPYIKGWIQTITKFEDLCLCSFIFGSLIKKEKKANDIDVCLILKDSKNYDKINKLKNELNKLSDKKIHLLLLTLDEFKEKINTQDDVIIEIITNIILITGENIFVEVIKNVQ